jgi:hypothetical protein
MKFKTIVSGVVLCLMGGICSTGLHAQPAGGVNASDSGHIISLAGEWRFLRGEPKLAAPPGALPKLGFSDLIQLPGTTDTNQKGRASGERATESLTQPWHFEGACWYQREITIPDGWRGQRSTLFLERTKYTQVWLDGQPVGEQAIFLTSQDYDLGRDLATGRHTLTIAVDNSRLPPFGTDAHQFSGNTQGNWNGIIGKIELRETDPVWIENAEIYPNAVERRITVKVHINNVTQTTGEGLLTLQATGEGVRPDATIVTNVQWSVSGTNLELQLALGPNAALWDEFHPTLLNLTLHLKGSSVDDECQFSFGLRNFVANGHQFTINGRPTFLRGKHDACVFPLTGHPPMDVAGWLGYFRICKSYGLNHIRFHSWTPPEAAFTAADQMGFYLQPELPFWGAFDEHARKVWESEAKRLISQFGNHPSFVMFSMGNEPWGGADVLALLVADLHAYDKRILYVRGSNGFSGDSRPGPGDDYYIGSDFQPESNGPRYQIRAANAGEHPGHVQVGPANTMTDYSNAVAHATLPLISHEMGQFTVFPDFKEIAKYTRAARAYDLERFQKMLADAGMADQDIAFAKASGALAALCYREEIESCLRTPNYGGFELLDLVDFPGQGSALVGILDAFMDSKGIITPEQWRQFCAPMVLLAKFQKYTWTQNETFTADLEIAQYGDEDLSRAALAWTLKDAAGKTLRAGELPPVNLARGNVRSIGKLSIPLAGFAAPAQLRLELSLPADKLATSYPLWIYPSQIDTALPANVKLVRTFDTDAEKTIAGGGRVLLVCNNTNKFARTVGGGFAPDFWNFQFFHGKPGTMGLLCDPATPALALFPTESHSNWEWFDIARDSQPLILDTVTPTTDRPLVQVIDNYARDHKLGLVFEMKVGQGRLLVCAADLIELAGQHPEAGQLLASLLAYAGSNQFSPKSSVSVAALRELFQTVIPMDGCKATASSFDPGWQGYKPFQLIDGNESKDWRADPKADGETWCQVEFPKATDLGACEILWENPDPGYRYLVQTSANGSDWQTVSDQRESHFTSARQRIPLGLKAVKILRIVITATPDNHAAAINEIRFFPPELP